MGEFRFKQFTVDDTGCGMKICSDSVLLAAWFLPPYIAATSVVDVGAGSGVLSLFAAEICHDAVVTALEIDEAAARCAQSNFGRSPHSSRLIMREGDFASFEPASTGIDLVISNPPYFTNGALSADTLRAGARHQCGLTYERLIGRSCQWLKADGHLGLVSPAEYEHSIIACAEFAGLKLRRMMRVRTSPRKLYTRVLYDFSRSDGAVAIESLDLRDKTGTYTPEYRALVEPYYKKI